MISFFIYTFLPLIGGIIVSIFSDVASYNIINKPILSPPSYIFPIVWTILYLLLGYSSYITKDDKKSLKIFYINLAINFIWTFIFFNLSNYFQGFILILIMILLEGILLFRYYKTNKKAFNINVIYTIWLLYAAYLSLGVYILNQ